MVYGGEPMNQATAARRLGTIVALGVVLAAGAARAQDAELPNLRPPVVNVNSELGVAAQGFSQNYREVSPTTPGTSLDSEHGTVIGGQVKATSMFNQFGVENLYVGAFYQYDSGGVHYNGGNLVTGAPVNTVSHYRVNDIGLEFGKGFLLTNNILITPLVESGWRQWTRELSADQAETYEHFYFGGGVRGDLGVTERLVLTGKAAIAETVSPTMTASAIPGFTPEMKFALGMAPLYQAEVGADYRFYSFLHLYGGVDYTHFSYGQSAVNTLGFLEPNSTTNEIVFRVGLALGF